MKFAKQLESEAESIPSEWRPYLIQYKALKKLISKVAEEIKSRGLSSELFHECLIYEGDNDEQQRHQMRKTDSSNDSIPRLKYYFTGEPPNIKPNIEFSYNPAEPQVRKVLAKLLDNDSNNEDDNDRNILDDSTSSDSNKPRRRSSSLLEYKRTSNNKDFFTLSSLNNNKSCTMTSEPEGEETTTASTCLVVQKQHRRDSTIMLVKELLQVTLAAKSDSREEKRNTMSATGNQQNYQEGQNQSVKPPAQQELKTLVIELEQDDEFFKALMEELQQATSLQYATTEKFKEEINELETRMTKATSPTSQKTDMYNWRYILSIYMDAQIFQQLHVLPSSSIANNTKSVAALNKTKQQMSWFLNQLKEQNLISKLKTKESKQAFEQFISLNTQLITMKHYQLLNQTAMRKILKKHDKRSGLNASQSFPDFVISGNSNGNSHSAMLFNTKLANMLYCLITQKLTTIIPQPDDYACPVCMNVAWRPIRLECQHVFCVRCLIKAQRKNMNSCPLCRHPTAVQSATALNLDEGLQNFLKLYFPREIKEKKRENEREQALEDIQAMTGKRYTEEQLMRMNRQYMNSGNRHQHPHDNVKCIIM